MTWLPSSTHLQHCLDWTAPVMSRLLRTLRAGARGSSEIKSMSNLERALRRRPARLGAASAPGLPEAPGPRAADTYPCPRPALPPTGPTAPTPAANPIDRHKRLSPVAPSHHHFRRAPKIEGRAWRGHDETKGSAGKGERENGGGEGGRLDGLTDGCLRGMTGVTAPRPQEPTQ